MDHARTLPLLLPILVACAGCAGEDAAQVTGTPVASAGAPARLEPASLRDASFAQLEHVDFEACELPASVRMRARGDVARLQGSEHDDLLCGGDGADEIEGSAGSDVLVGAGGDDWIATIGSEPDLLVGGDGDDEIAVAAARSTVLAGDGDDVVRLVDAHGVRVHCGAGDDVVELPAGDGDEPVSTADCETVR